MIAAIASLTATAVLLATPGAKSPEPLSLTLDHIAEHRVSQLVPLPEGEFVFPDDRPGLTLGYTFEPPAGFEVLTIDQPTVITATDSTGADLTGIAPDFMDRKTYLELFHVYGEAPSKFDLRLSLPSRGAESFDVDMTANATVFQREAEHTMPAPSDWTALPTSITDGDTIELRVGKIGSQTTIQIRPGTAYPRFVELWLGDTESNGAMWNDDTAQFFFDGETPDGAPLKAKIRVGLQTVPVTISLADHRLP